MHNTQFFLLFLYPQKQNRKLLLFYHGILGFISDSFGDICVNIFERYYIKAIHLQYIFNGIERICTVICRYLYHCSLSLFSLSANGKSIHSVLVTGNFYGNTINCRFNAVVADILHVERHSTVIFKYVLRANYTGKDLKIQILVGNACSINSKRQCKINVCIQVCRRKMYIYLQQQK